MRNTIIAFAISTLSLGFLASCSDNIVDQLESVTDESGRTVTIHANLGDESTKVSLTQYDSSLDMLARWDDDDVVKVILDWNGKLIELPVSRIHDLSDDRKGCLFSYTLPDGYDIPDGGYRIICFTMAPGVDAVTKPVEKGKEIAWGYALRRSPIDRFRGTLYYEGTFNDSNAAFTFTHLPTYEILHLYNVSNKECKFALNGFNNGDGFWYAFHATTTISAQDYIEPGGGTGGGGGRSWDVDDDVANETGGSRPVPSTKSDDASDQFSSPVVTVPAGSETLIVSSYIPTGRKISEARMVAEVNGEAIESENTKSSEAVLKTGNAYHMYASWDGFRLLFEDGPVIGRISLEEYEITIDVGTNNRAVYLSGSNDGYNVTSSNESVATAFASGNILYVNGIGAGECDITVSGDAGQQPAVLHVTVKGGDAPGEAVDLGLPSGIKWASCNLGASKPEEYGGYYQWAGLEDVTSTSIYLDYSNCPYHTGSSPSTGWTKYIPSFISSCWSGSGSPDNKTVLDPEDDVAHVKLGGKWRMPTRPEFQELIENCISEWTTLNGVYGIKFTSEKNGNSIFLPATGNRSDDNLGRVGSLGCYWSSWLYTNDPCDGYSICFFDFDDVYMGHSERFEGQSVRPVYDEGISGQAVISVSPEEVGFGTMPLGESATGSFTISNTGTAAASVSITNPSDVVTSDVSGDITIGAGASKTVTLTFTPKEKGSYGGRILVSCGGTDINVLYEGTCIEKNNDAPEAVDLGLPSGLKWASCNVGASKPEEYGGHYLWGGLQDVTDTSIYLYWDNCPHHTGSSYSKWTGWTKYIPSYKSSYWSGSGSPDNKTVLDPEDDVAHVKLGGKWRMPTDAEFKELIRNCTSEWTTLNGVKGRKFISKKNGNSIFLPAAGYRYYASLDPVGSCGDYWSSSLYTDPSLAWYMYFNYGEVYTGSGGRYDGLSVRPVLE